MKRAVIITWEGYQDQELLYPFYRLLEDNFAVDIAAANVGEIHGILGTKMTATKSVNDLKIEDYDLLILPGGVKALEKVRQEKRALDFIKEWHEKNKVIGSICHGAQLMISARITKGKKISGYYSIKDDIENSGATYVDAPYVTDSSIVSSPHYKHMGVWMREVLKIFYEKNAQNN